MPKHPRVIRDPVYDYVRVPPELDRIIDAPLFQRLRRIRQTSLTLAVYPSATGSRFEHALGTMHLAGEAWTAAWTNSDAPSREAFLAEVRSKVPTASEGPTPFAESVRIALSAVGLLHDVGHPPFSHALEPLFAHLQQLRTIDDPTMPNLRPHPGPYHEFAGRVLVRKHFAPLLPTQELSDLLIAIYEADEDSGSALGALHSLVAGQYDVDRTDYLARDNNRIGTEFGTVDVLRLVTSFELHQLPDDRFLIAPGISARSAIETLLIQRVQSYRWITFHPRIVGANTALARACDLAVSAATGRLPSLASDHTQAFSRSLPNLNYLEPDSEDLTRTFGQPPFREEHGVIEDLRLPLPDNQVALRAKLVDRACASVDDDTVTEMLKASIQNAQLLLESVELSPLARGDLELLLGFGEAALFRRKNFCVLWKTSDDYSETAENVRDPLWEKIRASYDELLEASPTNTSRHDDITLSRDLIKSQFDSDAIFGMNYVIRALLSDRTHRDNLMKILNDACNRVQDSPGNWMLHYQPFDAVGRHVEAFASDSRGLAVAIDLLEDARLIQSLRDVERAAPTLFGFFFLQYPHTQSTWREETVRSARSELRRYFESVFVEYVGAVWPAYLSIGFSEGSS